jgi:hypothetical protein
MFKRVGFRFLHRIARIEPMPIGFHHIRTPLSLRRSFTTSGDSVFQQGKNAWNNTKVTYYSLPISIALTYIAINHFVKVLKRESESEEETEGPVHTRVEGPFHVFIINID